jgi:uncharacterized Zn finger protein
LDVLDSFGWRSRRLGGRVRSDHVLDWKLTPGQIQASVQGMRRSPYQVEIGVRTFDDAQWEHIVDAMARQALFAAQLLAGEMPRDVESLFRARGLSVFPSAAEVTMACTCSDWVLPCEHILAVHHVLAERFDEDPFLIFALRGRTRAEVMDALRMRRVAGVDATRKEAEAVDGEPERQPLAPVAGEHPQGFWEPRDAMLGFRVRVEAPSVESAVLKRLGPPSFSTRPQAFVGALSLVCGSVTRRALRLAFGEEDAHGDDVGPRRE